MNTANRFLQALLVIPAVLYPGASLLHASLNINGVLSGTSWSAIYDLTKDLQFTTTEASASGNEIYLMLDDWVTYDGNTDSHGITLNNAIPFEITRGGSSLSSGTLNPGRIADNWGNNNGDYTPGDGTISLQVASGSFAYQAGDVITLKATTRFGTSNGSTNGLGTFNSQADNASILNIRLGNGNWNATSPRGVFVPEPSTYALLLGGAALAVALFRRKR